jgi:hypothetical protein
VSPVIIGNNFGLASIPFGRPCGCAISRAFPARPHRTFECPIKYWHLRGACPGWTSSGARVAASWAGDDITAACQAEWRAFAATLPTAKSMGTAEAQF